MGFGTNTCQQKSILYYSVVPCLNTICTVQRLIIYASLCGQIKQIQKIKNKNDIKNC